jgi:hypothetical protein
MKMTFNLGENLRDGSSLLPSPESRLSLFLIAFFCYIASSCIAGRFTPNVPD